MIDPERLMVLSRATVSRMNIPAYLFEDAVAEGIAAAVHSTKMWSLDRGAAPEPFAILHIRWAVRDLLKREYRHPQTYLDAVQEESLAEPDRLEYRYRLIDVLAALAKLDGETREILMAFAEGRRMAEISRRYKQTGACLSQRRNEALAQLRNAVTI